MPIAIPMEDLPRETLNRMSKRELNKLIKDLTLDAETSASEILQLSTPREIIEVSEGLGVPLATKEEQLREILEIIEEYRREYSPKEELEKLAETSPHLSIILETWNHYEELLHKEGLL
ncbi:hypothetical protein [Thermococcus aciditolerans]|uniref:Uncharacterized protein n=1 Tax=Thermococcus aciditolerans TaxID=2598455 RepID=A0A5C0SN19_9EURY|nr:hypothetical protein [Thermococcus aciditolerans]QEK14578.1 hypothetical protein FPV09_05075 [Thermococcus aciditolerans]